MTEKKHSALWLRFAALVFAAIFAVFTAVTLVWYILFRCGALRVNPFGHQLPPILPFALCSLFLGGIIALYVGRLIIRPIQNISDAFDELSAGNFDVKVSENERIKEIREMAQHFNAMTYDLSHIETLRSDFVASVSHEFKTPIASIEGYATLLQSHNLSQEKHDHYVEKILENSQRLANLSGNVLMLSKLENQEIIPGKAEFRLDEQLRKCILLLENKWTEKELEWDIDLLRKTYYGSEELLEQVWINLLDNAIKHSPQGGLISVTLTDTEAALVVCVADYGDGMTEEVQKHIFEKFYQGDPSHKADGNGLGLALVKRIVELSKGQISVKSSPGSGTKFEVSLPKE